jgi:hypothetical protein
MILRRLLLFGAGSDGTADLMEVLKLRLIFRSLI